MKNLTIPKFKNNETIKEIYSSCAGNLKNPIALKFTQKVVKSSNEYVKYVPRDIEHFLMDKVKTDEKKEILKVYDYKFAKKDSIGRPYYDAIKGNAGGQCPICGEDVVEHLDHFLPKSDYPLLCVTPENLVPTCRNCNIDKGTYFDKKYSLLPLNPYFDKYEDIWLKCDIIYKNDNTCATVFRNGYEKSLNEELWEKFETHISVYKLNKKFSLKACNELESCAGQYKFLLAKCGKEVVKEALKEQKIGCEKIDKNSWRSALYRELVNEVDEYCRWLTRK